MACSDDGTEIRVVDLWAGGVTFDLVGGAFKAGTPSYGGWPTSPIFVKSIFFSPN
jgi:hypothetical protein